MGNFLNDNSTAQFLLVAVAFTAFALFLRWLAPRIRHHPTEDYKPSEHHWWGMILCLLGACALVVVLSLGYGEPVAQAAGEVVDTVIEAAEDVIE